jgi:hypothetical protein
MEHFLQKKSKKPSHQGYQDEHDCCHTAFSSLRHLYQNGRMAMTVMGRPVVGKVWIHYCVGDSQWNNRWLGHFNGSGNINHPCQDCNCQMWDVDKPTTNCQYITRQDYFVQKIQIEACTNESAKREVCKEFSKHNIVNAFMHEDVQLSDQLHGIYCMTPPERLHTTSEGLTKYMIDTLCNTIGDVGDEKKLLTKKENLHCDNL